MNTTASDLDRYRLYTNFCEGYKEHIIDCDSGTRTERWTRERPIGEGAFGAVWLERGEAGALRAVKQMLKSNALMNKRELHALMQLRVHSQYFVQIFGWFENEENTYLAMEYMPLGSLAGHIPKGGMAEGNAKIITKQILEGLKIMHDNSFCHRDLKPANILIVSLTPNIRVKIGTSKQKVDGTALRTQVGTIDYIAPEVWILPSRTSTYTKPADVWSLGCLTHVLMTGKTPFPELPVLCQYIQKRSAISFPERKLRKTNASRTAINFITSLMAPLPRNRLTAGQALQHSWLNIEEQGQGQEQGQERRETSLGREISDEETPDEETCGEDPSDEEITGVVYDSGQDTIVPNGQTARIPMNPYYRQLNLSTQTRHEPEPEYSMPAESLSRIIPQEYCLDEGGPPRVRSETAGAGAGSEAVDGWSRIVEETDVLEGEWWAAGRNSRDEHSYSPRNYVHPIKEAPHICITPHCAAQHGNIEAMKLFIEEGKDITTKDANRWTALHHASRNGHEDMVKLLLVKGVDIMVEGRNRDTALHLAAWKGSEGVVRLLIEKRADIKAKKEKRKTALHLAAWSGHEDLVRLLLEKGAKIVKEHKGDTALHFTALNGYEGVARLLLEKGADIMARNNDGSTALHFAAWEGYEGVTKLLLEKGADTLMRNNDRNTALHLAAWKGHEELVKLLLGKKPNTLSKNRDGSTALYLAVSKGHKEVARLLVEDGADIMARNNNGRTALDEAISQKNRKMVEILGMGGVDQEDKKLFSFSRMFSTKRSKVSKGEL